MMKNLFKAQDAAKGLKNLGNTCFLNSVLQACSSCPPFVRYIETLDSSGEKNVFASKLLKCMKEIRSSSDSIFSGAHNPQDVLKLIRKANEDFQGNDQHDAQELFQAVVALLSKPINSKAKRPNGLAGIADFDDSELLSDTKLSMALPPHLSFDSLANSSPFEGLIASQLICEECNTNRPMNHEPFVSLSLPIPPQKTMSSKLKLSDCIELFTSGERIPGVNCNCCSLLASMKKTQQDITSNLASLSHFNINISTPPNSPSSSIDSFSSVPSSPHSSSLNLQHKQSQSKQHNQQQQLLSQLNNFEGIEHRSNEYDNDSEDSFDEGPPPLVPLHSTSTSPLSGDEDCGLSSHQSGYSLSHSLSNHSTSTSLPPPPPPPPPIRISTSSSPSSSSSQSISAMSPLSSSSIDPSSPYSHLTPGTLQVLQQLNHQNLLYHTLSSTVLRGPNDAWTADPDDEDVMLSDTLSFYSLSSYCGDSSIASFSPSSSSISLTSLGSTVSPSPLSSRVNSSSHLLPPPPPSSLSHSQLQSPSSLSIKSSYPSLSSLHSAPSSLSLSQSISPRSLTHFPINSPLSTHHLPSSSSSSSLHSSFTFPLTASSSSHSSSSSSSSSIISPFSRTNPYLSSSIAPSPVSSLSSPSLTTIRMLHTLRSSVKESRVDKPMRKKLLLSRLPSLLCFHLCRRVFDERTGQMRKISTIVRFDLEMDMAPYFSPGSQTWSAVLSGVGAGAGRGGLGLGLGMGLDVTSFHARRPASSSASSTSSSASSRRWLYSLRAVIVHRGSAHGGHYVCYCLIGDTDSDPTHPNTGTGTGSHWRYFSDDFTRVVDVSEVLAQEAYMLFYEKKVPPSSSPSTSSSHPKNSSNKKMTMS